MAVRGTIVVQALSGQRHCLQSHGSVEFSDLGRGEA